MVGHPAASVSCAAHVDAARELAGRSLREAIDHIEANSAAENAKAAGTAKTAETAAVLMLTLYFCVHHFTPK